MEKSEGRRGEGRRVRCVRGEEGGTELHAP